MLQLLCIGRGLWIVIVLSFSLSLQVINVVMHSATRVYIGLFAYAVRGTSARRLV